MFSISPEQLSLCLELRRRALANSVEEDLSEIAEFLRGTSLDGVLPLASEYFLERPIHCWDCGNTLDSEVAISQEIEEGGFPLRVPVCPACYPIPTDGADPAMSDVSSHSNDDQLTANAFDVLDVFVRMAPAQRARAVLVVRERLLAAQGPAVPLASLGFVEALEALSASLQGRHPEGLRAEIESLGGIE